MAGILSPFSQLSGSLPSEASVFYIRSCSLCCVLAWLKHSHPARKHVCWPATCCSSTGVASQPCFASSMRLLPRIEGSGEYRADSVAAEASRRYGRRTVCRCFDQQRTYIVVWFTGFIAYEDHSCSALVVARSDHLIWMPECPKSCLIQAFTFRCSRCSPAAWRDPGQTYH